MITPTFSLTATERVLPRLALDFTTASLDSRVTFTRTGNTATVTNSSGFVVPINADLPRFDFDAVALTCKGLLIEESRTNLCLYSENLSLGWTKTRSTSSADAAIAPSNTLTADKLIEDSTAGQSHFALSSSIVSVSGTYTATVYLKAAEDSYAFLGMSDLTTGGAERRINLSTGVVDATNVGAVGSWTSISGSSTNAGNGWWRMTVTATQGAGTSIAMQIYIGNSAGARVFSGNGVNGIFVWGAQVELASFGTSYIPTVASQVTRTADVASMTGSNFSSWYNASEGAFVSSSVLSRQSSTGATAIFSANDNTAANLINCFYRASGALGSNIFAATVSQFDQTQLGVTTANVVVNTGVSYKLNDAVSYANGTVQSTDTSVTVPTINQLQLGFTPTGAYLNGWLRNLRFYKQRILNAEGQAFTK